MTSFIYAWFCISSDCRESQGWLNVVKECQIETSTKKIMDSLKTVKLEEDEVIVSFDVLTVPHCILTFRFEK